MAKLNKLLKQAQKMQAMLAKAQEELANERIEGKAGGGAVIAVVNGHQELLEIKISKDVVDPEDVEMLEDLVFAAVSDALKKSKELAASKLGALTGGMNIPFFG